MDRDQMSAQADSLRRSAPKLPQAIGRAELDAFPCAVEERQVEVPGEPPVTVYLTLPEDRRPGAPLIVNYHGGGFIRGRGDRDELFCRRTACAFRGVVVDVDYALCPDHPFPTAVRQARAAALWARNQAEALGCDRDRVVLLGQSAGGNLVANVCMAEAEEPAVDPVCAVLAYAPLDLRTDPAEKPCRERDMPADRARQYNALYCAPEQAGDPRVSPLFAPEERLRAFPPTLVLTAGDDRLAPEGEEFALRLARAGVPATCKRFPNCVHGFFINRMDDWEAGVALVHRFVAHCLEER